APRRPADRARVAPPPARCSVPVAPIIHRATPGEVMKRVRPFALGLLAALAACGGRDYTAKDFYGFLPDLVRFADADARQAAAPKPPEGPLWIDVNSFAGGAWQLTYQKMERDSVMAHLGVPGAQKIGKPQEAIMLEDTGTVAATPEAIHGVP